MSSSDTVMVPREPTEEMLDAGQKPHGQDKTGVQRNSVRAAYRAMLAASPQQSPAGEGGEPRAWMWRQLMHDSQGGWEQKTERYPPGDWVRPEDIQELTPLYTAPPVPSVSGVEDQGSSLRDTQPEAETAVVEHMVQRFLSWHLPANFNPDNGISFKPTFNDHMPFGPMWCNPTGTNLFDYDQAKAMVLHMLEGLPK